MAAGAQRCPGSRGRKADLVLAAEPHEAVPGLGGAPRPKSGPRFPFSNPIPGDSMASVCSHLGTHIRKPASPAPAEEQDPGTQSQGSTSPSPAGLCPGPCHPATVGLESGMQERAPSAAESTLEREALRIH